MSYLIAWALTLAAVLAWLIVWRGPAHAAKVTDPYGMQAAEFARDLAAWDRAGRPDVHP